MALHKAQSESQLKDEGTNARIAYRAKGGLPQGSLYKGNTANAFTKKTIGSIPSKFEIVLYPQDSPIKKGFGSNSFRFTSAATDSPGPGEYIDPMRTSVESLKQASDSYSRKGYGNGFVSQKDRFKIENYFPYQVPGPGSYKAELGLRPEEKVVGPAFGPGSVSERYKNKGLSAFAPEIGKRRVQSTSPPAPGPGSYNIPRSITNTQDYHNVAPFRSQNYRFLNADKGLPPGPGYYETDMEGIRRQLLGNVLSAAGEIAATPSFKQPTGSKRVKVNLYDPFENVEGEEKRSPGPGHYAEDHNTLMRKASEKAQAGVSHMFASPDIVDRFGRVKREVKAALESATPGPGQYFKAEKERVEEEERGGAAASFPFKSDVKRISYLPMQRGPGPAFYKLKTEFVKDSKNITFFRVSLAGLLGSCNLQLVTVGT